MTAPTRSRERSWTSGLQRASTCMERWRRRIDGKGSIEREAERQLVIKTTRERIPELERRVRELHPYELPEFVVVAVEGGSEAYLRWISAETEFP